MDIKRLKLIVLTVFLASCATVERGVKSEEGSLLKNYGLAVCLGAAFESDELGRDVNKSANGYMERGSLPLEAYEAVREAANEWLQRDYPSKHGGQVKSAACIDFYNSAELEAIFEDYAY